MWSSAVAHVLKAPTLFSCVFRDAVTSGYSSYCCLPIGLKQSGHSPLTSGTNKAFFYYCYFLISFLRPRDGSVGKSQ